MLSRLLLLLLLLFTALNTTFCSWGEQWRCEEVRLDLGGEEEEEGGLEEALLLGLWNLKGAALYLGLMSLTWVSSSLHRTLFGPCCCCCWSSSTTLAMMVFTVLVMGILTQDTGLLPLLITAADCCLSDCWLMSTVCCLLSTDC